eukprot:TRINITY_DN976_c1_g7_i1.p1 TRINITY_DN976_c1_g7~~TRINITY_DN976_c1_g7_i1.p1  ORF type:complete len:516 (-),score=152.47 TRINITY_DN976_c1_g7_i1:258-1805(-)
MKKSKKGLGGKIKSKKLKQNSDSYLWNIEKLDETNFNIGYMFVKSCITWLKEKDRGLIQGIFRKAGSEYRIKELQSSTQKVISKDSTVPVKLSDFSFPPDEDPHVVANLLKRYFKEFHEPIFTFDLYSLFIAASGSTDEEEKLKTVKTTLLMLPNYNLKMLDLLFGYLHDLSKTHEVTLMDVHNLSIVFAPNLLRPKVETPLILISDAGYSTNLIEVLIEEYDLFFKNKSNVLELKKEEIKEFSSSLRKIYSSHSLSSLEALKQVKDQNQIEERSWKKKLNAITMKLKTGDSYTIDKFYEPQGLEYSDSTGHSSASSQTSLNDKAPPPPPPPPAHSPPPVPTPNPPPSNDLSSSVPASTHLTNRIKLKTRSRHRRSQSLLRPEKFSVFNDLAVAIISPTTSQGNIDVHVDEVKQNNNDGDDDKSDDSTKSPEDEEDYGDIEGDVDGDGDGDGDGEGDEHDKEEVNCNQNYDVDEDEVQREMREIMSHIYGASYTDNNSTNEDSTDIKKILKDIYY